MTTAAAERLRTLVRDIPDFPRPGIVFRDITPLLADGDALRLAVDEMTQPFRDARIDLVAGIESRGFILGGAVALSLRCGFATVRKEGRLPHTTMSESYQLEYGSAVIEVHADALTQGQRVLVVDDLLATGGTARAAASLVRRLGGVVAGFSFLIELAPLHGRDALDDAPVSAVLRY